MTYRIPKKVVTCPDATRSAGSSATGMLTKSLRGLAARERRFVQTLLAMRPSVLAALGSPRGLEGYEGAVAEVCAYSDVAASQHALAAALAGSGRRTEDG